MPGKLTREEAYAYLDSRPGWMILTTVGRDGFPHSVPVGYLRRGDDIYVGGRAGNQRTMNVVRNSRVSVLVESGSSMQDLKGLMIQGEAEVITDPSEVLGLMREAARQRGTPEGGLPTEPRPDFAYIHIRPRRFVSWDYSRET